MPRELLVCKLRFGAFRHRDHAELLHLTQVVPRSPVLGYLANGKTEPVHALDRETPSGQRDVPDLALVGAAERHTGGTLLPSGDHVLDVEVEVGEGSVHAPDQVLVPIDATLMLANHRRIDNIRRHELVVGVRVVFVSDLFGYPAYDGLVLFRHRLLSFP